MMPRNIDATKSKMRTKSTKKPLRDVSNAKTAVKPVNVFKKTSEDDGGGHTADGSLDRLLLVHSDLSSLLRTIDELVVQALQLTSNKGRMEVKQFAEFLSDMQTSVKPWVPRFQKALSSQSTGPENKPEQSMERNIVCEPKESVNAISESPEQTKWESLVSPSPLVSWRAECKTEGGRQLFLLTPLPQKKAFSAKCQASPILVFGQKITMDEIALPRSLADSVPDMGDDNIPKGALLKPTPNEVLDIEKTKAVGNHRFHSTCGSPTTLSKTNFGTFVMTPCLKVSPPKSCILLEPISELSRKKNQGIHICTPFPARFQNCSESLDSESSSSGQSSDDLNVKYPELLGIKKDNLGRRIMAAEDSPNWIVSPPKTCVIMEPPNEKLSKSLSGNCLLPETTAVDNQQHKLPSMMNEEYQDISGTLDLAESTPMVEAMSSFRMGKLHPGENTLKKELWTKFEAASTHVIRFDGCISQNDTKKGFLDRLEEEAYDA